VNGAVAVDVGVEVRDGVAVVVEVGVHDEGEVDVAGAVDVKTDV